MNIETMLLGQKARADEDALNEMRDACDAMLSIASRYKYFMPLADELSDQIESLDMYIEGLRREDRYAEENAKYREDRLNA